MANERKKQPRRLVTAERKRDNANDLMRELEEQIAETPATSITSTTLVSGYPRSATTSIIAWRMRCRWDSVTASRGSP